MLKNRYRLHPIDLSFLRISCIVASAVFSSTLFSSTAFCSDFHSPRSDALGGAGHAGPLLNDAIYLNPSYTSLLQTHSLSVNYLSFGGGTIQFPSGSSDFYGHNLNASVIDGTDESIFQAGVGYTRRDDYSFVHIGASKAFVKKYGVGLGSKFIFPSNGGSQSVEGSLSFTGALARWFQTALIVDNLFESAKDRGFEREIIIGTKFNIQSILMIYLDPHFFPSVSDNAWGYEIGAEFPFFSQVFLRIGKFLNSTIPYEGRYGNGYGMGVGWLAPKLSLDYGFSRVQSPIASHSHHFGFTIYF